MEKDQTRNLHPHQEAYLAMCIWGQAYSEQRGGCMDFWDKVDEHAKDFIRDILKRVRELPTESDARTP